MLEDVGISDPDRRIDQRPFELSGGMCQRVMIACALISRPTILIADEPSTALDVTIQAQILDLLRHLAIERRTAVVLITHDMGVVADIADRVAVMYAGRIAESGPTEAIFAAPRHPYTALLLASIPRLSDTPKSQLATIEGRVPTPAEYRLGLPLRQPLSARRCTLQQRNPETAQHRPRPFHRLSSCRGDGMSDTLQITDLKVHFPGRGGAPIRAVDGVSLSIAPHETLGLVGESGCGKSTVSNATVGLVPPTSGSVRVLGTELAGADTRTLRAVRARAQMVFQDPVTSLNPRMTVGAAIGEPLLVRNLARGIALRTRVTELLEEVGLRPEHASRYPHQFSGGQRQRIVIARALALRPALLVCDEPVSALDVSVRAQILNLLVELQSRHGMSMLFVSHDLAVVRHVCDRVAVMYLGLLAELAPSDVLYSQPRHPYTKALLAAVPEPDPVAQRAKPRVPLTGEIPSPANPPSGCRFHTRCPIAIDICHHEVPAWRPVGNSQVACHLV